MGGYSVTVPRAETGEPTRAYLVQTAEKGIVWLRLHARGRAGHGSVPTDANAVVRLAEAVGRIAGYPWPREYIASVRALLDGISDLTGTPYAPDDPTPILRHLGGAAGFVLGTLSDTSAFTMLDAGYKINVILQTASASLDCRFLPGHEDDLMTTVRELAGEHVEVVLEHRDIALDSTAVRGPVHGDDAVAAGGGPRRRRAAVLPVRRYRQQGAQPARDHRLRVRAAAAARPYRLRADVPRDRRAGPGGVAAVRHASTGGVPPARLTMSRVPERKSPDDQWNSVEKRRQALGAKCTSAAVVASTAVARANSAPTATAKARTLCPTPTRRSRSPCGGRAGRRTGARRCRGAA